MTFQVCECYSNAARSTAMSGSWAQDRAGEEQGRNPVPHHVPSPAASHAASASASPSRPRGVPPLDIAAAVIAAAGELSDDGCSDGSASGPSGAQIRVPGLPAAVLPLGTTLLVHETGMWSMRRAGIIDTPLTPCLCRQPRCRTTQQRRLEHCGRATQQRRLEHRGRAACCAAACQRVRRRVGGCRRPTASVLAGARRSLRQWT